MNHHVTERGPRRKDEREFLLASLRVASLNCRTLAVEIDSIGVALSGELIPMDAVLEWLSDLGVLHYLPDAPPIGVRG